MCLLLLDEIPLICPTVIIFNGVNNYAPVKLVSGDP
jgi:hypothetical protein